jgi:hypothetical protein
MIQMFQVTGDTWAWPWKYRQLMMWSMGAEGLMTF